VGTSVKNDDINQPLFSTENCNKTALASESLRLATILKVKTKNRKHSATKPQPKTRPLHHGDTETRSKEINGFLPDRWFICGFVQGRIVDISTLCLQQKDEGTEKQRQGINFWAKI